MINILIERVYGCPSAIALLPKVIRNEGNEYKEGEFIIEELCGHPGFCPQDTVSCCLGSSTLLGLGNGAQYDAGDLIMFY